MKRIAAGLFFLFAAGPVMVLNAGAQDAAAALAANNFYTTTRALPRAAGIPAPSAQARLQPLLSARLARLMSEAAAAQARFRARVPFAPPLLEGDLFSSALEGPASFRVGACNGTPAAQRCRIEFTRPPAAMARGPVQPGTWNDDLLLINEGGVWKVDDVDYRGGFAYGNTGLLSQSLAMVIRSAS
jgi:hypothetical protein